MKSAKALNRTNADDDIICELLLGLIHLTGNECNEQELKCMVKEATGVSLLLRNVLYKSGDSSPHVYFIVKGQVRVAGGVYRAGQFLGEEEALAGSKRLNTAECSENGSLLLRLNVDLYKATLQWRVKLFQQKVQFLQSIKLFEGLDQEELSLISPQFEPKTYLPGQIIVTQNAPADSMFVIREGRVGIHVSEPGKAPDTSSKTKVCCLGEKTLIGDMSVLPQVTKRTATVVAECTVLTFSIQRWVDLSLPVKVR